jgi:hypothetical protein
MKNRYRQTLQPEIATIYRTLSTSLCGAALALDFVGFSAAINDHENTNQISTANS